MVSNCRFTTRILVLAEDGCAEPLRALVWKMLRLVEPRYDANRIDMESSTGSLARGKSRQHSHKRLVEIARHIATTVFRENNFALYHTDADRTFSDPRRDQPENVRFYENKVLVVVRQHIEDLRARHGDMRSTDSIMLRIQLLLPYYSIEAWLLQNTQVGQELCKKHHGGRHLDDFRGWEAERGRLDEIEKPKERACIGDRFNRELAGAVA